ncbi:cleavage and polyadenylation specificity factor subunit 1 [Perkinsela sp. CCAP 1560/4]|nr:cleavage and polyadenylation specificity factor subunit 1 [Perkinsela sp. CCAP 1560/4]|eukprot:KNH06981.1 cleavage and polyadenylation specificity factor subunit 1 [Perkinsela sp. CCAP 1560/4]
MEKAAFTEEIFPTSATISVLHGRFLNSKSENLVIVFRDRIELFFSQNADVDIPRTEFERPQFMCAQRFSEEIVLATSIHLPQNYLRNHLDAHDSSVAQKYGEASEEMVVRRQLLEEGNIDAVVLVFKNHSVRILVYSVAETDGIIDSWSDVALYILDKPEALENGSQLSGQVTLQKIFTDEKHSCVMILDDSRWIHVLPMSVKRIGENVIGTGKIEPTDSAQCVDSWASILEMGASETHNDELDKNSARSADWPAAHGRIFFEFPPATLEIDASAPYSLIDLRSLSPPICSVIDCIHLVGYSDPCFLFLHQPHLTWSGRMKVRSATTDASADDQKEKPENPDEHSLNESSMTLSIEEGKRMLSATLSIVSFDLKQLSSAQSRKSARVVWSFDGLPYNCTNLYLIKDPFSHNTGGSNTFADPSEKLRSRFGGGILIFSVNCVFFLTITGRRMCYCSFLNAHGAEELSSEKNQLVLCPAVGSNAVQGSMNRIASLTLSNCKPMYVTSNKFLLILSDGETITMGIGFSDANHQMVSAFSFGFYSNGSALAMNTALPYPSSIVPLGRRVCTNGERKDCLHLSFISASNFGDTIIVDYSDDNSREIDRGILTTRFTLAASICPVNDFEVFSRHEDLSLSLSSWEKSYPHAELITNQPIRPEGRTHEVNWDYFDACVRSTYIAVVSGDGNASSRLSFLMKKIVPEVCARFATPRKKQGLCKYLTQIDMGENVSLLCASDEYSTEFLVMDSEGLIDVTPSERRVHERASDTKEKNRMRQTYANFKTEPTICFKPMHRHFPELFPHQLMLQVTATGCLFFALYDEVWEQVALWSLEWVIEDKGVYLKKAFVMHSDQELRERQPASLSFPLVMISSTGRMISQTVSIDFGSSEKVLKVEFKGAYVQSCETSSRYLAGRGVHEKTSTIPIESLCQINAQVMMGFDEINANMMLWGISQGTECRRFSLHPIEAPPTVHNGLSALRGKKVVETYATESALVIRTEECSDVYVFQLTTIRKDMKDMGEHQLPFHASLIYSPRTDRPETQTALQVLLHPISTPSLNGIAVGGACPKWIVTSSQTGEVFIHSQRQGRNPMNVSAMCMLQGGVEVGSYADNSYHHFIQVSDGVFNIMRISRAFSYDSPCPIQRITYNQSEFGLGTTHSGDRTCTPVRILKLHCASSQPRVYPHGAIQRSETGFDIDCVSDTRLCILQKNTEKWSAMLDHQTNTNGVKGIHPPLTITTYSLALFSVKSYGKPTKADTVDFSAYETILDISAVHLKVHSHESAVERVDFKDDNYEWQRLLAVGSSFPTNEEQHCTGSLYFFTVESKTVQESSQNSTPEPKLYLVEAFKQQGPVTSVNALSNGLFTCTVGAKVMIFRLEKRPRHHPTYSHEAEGKYRSCYPHNAFIHELTPLYFFYSHSSLYVSSIASFDRYIALTDLFRSTNLYRLDCYPQDKKDHIGNAPVGFSKPADTRGPDETQICDERDYYRSSSIGSCVAVHAGTDSQPFDVTAVAFLFSPTVAADASQETHSSDVYLAISNVAGELVLMTYPCSAAIDESAKYKRDKGIRSLEVVWKSSIPGRITQMKRINMPQYASSSSSARAENPSTYVASNISGLLLATTEGALELSTVLTVDSDALLELSMTASKNRLRSNVKFGDDEKQRETSKVSMILNADEIQLSNSQVPGLAEKLCRTRSKVNEVMHSLF